MDGWTLPPDPLLWHLRRGEFRGQALQLLQPLLANLLGHLASAAERRAEAGVGCTGGWGLKQVAVAPRSGLSVWWLHFAEVQW